MGGAKEICAIYIKLYIRILIHKICYLKHFICPFLAASCWKIVTFCDYSVTCNFPSNCLFYRSLGRVLRELLLSQILTCPGLFFLQFIKLPKCEPAQQVTDTPLKGELCFSQFRQNLINNKVKLNGLKSTYSRKS